MCQEAAGVEQNLDGWRRSKRAHAKDDLVCLIMSELDTRTRDIPERAGTSGGEVLRWGNRWTNAQVRPEATGQHEYGHDNQWQSLRPHRLKRNKCSEGMMASIMGWQ